MAETSSANTADGFDGEKALTLSGVLVTALVGLVGVFTIQGTPAFPLACLLTVIQVALFVALLTAKESRAHHLIFWCEALIIAVLLFLIAASFIVILTVVWLVQAVELYGPRRAMALLLASLALFTAAQLMHFGLDEGFNILISSMLYGLLQFFAVSVVQRFISEREQKERVAELNRELIATRQLLSESAAQSERLRIARDLHDILGHHMTALILNLEVASHGVDGEAKEQVVQSLALAKLLLGDLRSTVSELRDDSSIDLEKSVRKLVSGIPNFDIDIDFSSAPQIEDIDQAEILLRCTQEAVTNVLRHSNGDRCRITLRRGNDNCVLTIEDNGRQTERIEPGNGLTGMMERVTSQGGSLNWYKDEEGFRLEVLLNIESGS